MLSFLGHQTEIAGVVEFVKDVGGVEVVCSELVELVERVVVEDDTKVEVVGVVEDVEVAAEANTIEDVDATVITASGRSI